MTAFPEHSRSDVVACARQWIGTPYHHQASRLGVGVDCIGLVRGVWRALYGSEPEGLPGYGRDWAEATGRETLLEAGRRHFVEVAPDAVRAGDVLLFRYRPQAVAKHAGILTPSAEIGRELHEGDPSASQLGDPAARFSLIHALERAPVTEVPFIGWWRRRIAAAFRFPGVID